MAALRGFWYLILYGSVSVTRLIVGVMKNGMERWGRAEGEFLLKDLSLTDCFRVVSSSEGWKIHTTRLPGFQASRLT